MSLGVGDKLLSQELLRQSLLITLRVIKLEDLKFNLQKDFGNIYFVWRLMLMFKLSLTINNLCCVKRKQNLHCALLATAELTEHF